MDRMATTGIVTNQVIKISLSTSHLTAFGFSAEPAPIIVEVTIWVVETGKPKSAAPEIIIAEEL